MFYNNAILMATNGQPVYLLPQMANRHGLITGATGTGKTVTVKVMAEAFSEAGVPVFLSDIKGDLAGMSLPGVNTENMQARIERFGLAPLGWQYKAFPTAYWDVFSRKGLPVRATVSEMGPLLLSRLMDLTAAQEGVMNIIFRIADDQGLLLLDLKDLRAVVQAVGDHAADYKTTYGNIATASIGAIQRGLLKLENQGAQLFFGEPALDIMDWIRCDAYGKGVINVLNCEELFQKPDLYTAFLLWMLSELYETLPEAGDLDKPRMVFFFDEAHLLFKLKSKELLEKVEQVIRLIRSKGVGVYFITQNPADIPDTVLSQLGNKIQHALRAYTPAEQKAVRAAAQSYVVNPEFNTQEVIPQLGNAEALISFLDAKGVPQMVQRAFILPPQSMMGTVDDSVISQVVLGSDMYPKYSQTIDRHSAYELLNGIMPSGTTLDYSLSGLSAQPEPVLQSAPVQDGSWTCPACGSVNAGNFCGNCGNARPAADTSAPASAQQPSYAAAPSVQGFQTNYQTSQYEQSMNPQTSFIQSAAQTPAEPVYSQPSYSQPSYSQPAYAQPSVQSGVMYAGPSLVQAVQAQAAADAAKLAGKDAAELEKMKKEAVKQAKAELKAEAEANKESDLVKTAKSIATSGARTAVNTLVRGALGGLMKKK